MTSFCVPCLRDHLKYVSELSNIGMSPEVLSRSGSVVYLSAVTKSLTDTQEATCVTSNTCQKTYICYVFFFSSA